jgi:hypothetical protein
MNSASKFFNRVTKGHLVRAKRKRKECQAELRRKRDMQTALFYDNEFKQWHYKFVLIVAATFGCSYCVAYAVAAILK